MSALKVVKQERFCHEYVKDVDGRKAALRAGYALGRHTGKTVLRLLNDEQVRARVAELQEARAKADSGAHAGWVVAQLVKIARADPRKFFHADGTPRKVHELGDEEAAALSGFEANGDAGKVVDRLKVLELLGRHLGLWQQKPMPAHEAGLFDGMSLDDVRKVREKVGKLLAEAGIDPRKAASRDRRF